MVNDTKNGTFDKFHNYIIKKSHINGHMEKELDPRAIKNLGGDSIYITFDMCPSNKIDREVIDFLIKNKIPATFMISYKWFQLNKKENLDFLKNPLFSIQGHGYEHLRITDLSEDEQKLEIDKTIKFISDEFGINIKYYRFPHGIFTDYSIKYLNSKGIEFLAWSNKILDRFRLSDKENIRKLYLEETLKNIKNGDVLILHANGLGYKTLETLEYIKEWNLKFNKI